jgi:hypothetical protein
MPRVSTCEHRVTARKTKEEAMRRLSLVHIAAAVFAASVVLVVATKAEAGGNTSRGGQFSFRLESGGRVLPTHHHHGRTYVEGRRGERYQIRVVNHTGGRIEAVVTVDGRDVITGRRGNYRNQRGYVIRPYGSVTIDGFRTSWSGVAAFRFTEVYDSYAARMGDASNVGVVGVAVFKERSYQPRPRPPIAYGKRKSGLGSSYGGAAPAPSAEADESASGRAYDSMREPRRQGIGTGYGEDQYSPASETSFERRNKRRPDARLKLYYDDREGLIARGVIPRPYYPPPPPPYPYPEPYPYYDPGFAPPPPPYYWE